MSRFIGTSFAAGFALFLVAATASAQGMPPSAFSRPNYGVGYQPQLSPYLNLANGGDPAVQYFLRTLPEFNRRATNSAFSAAIGSLEDRALQPPPVGVSDADLFTPLPTTGHPTAFHYTGGYFPASPLRPASGYSPQQIRR